MKAGMIRATKPSFIIFFSLIAFLGHPLAGQASLAPYFPAPAETKTDRKAEKIPATHPIVQAVDLDRADLVGKWLKQGHSPITRIQNRMNERLLDRAANQHAVKVFRLLLQAIRSREPSAKLVDARGTPLLIALTSLAIPARKNHVLYETMAEALLQVSPASVHDRDKAYVGDGRTALHEAAAMGNVKLMKAYVAAKADINAKNASGETPLHFAARFGRLDAIRYLVSAGARINERTTYTKATPLMAAAEMGQEMTIRLLMQSGANKGIKDAFGKTPPQRYREYAAVSPGGVAGRSKKR